VDGAGVGDCATVFVAKPAHKAAARSDGFMFIVIEASQGGETRLFVIGVDVGSQFDGGETRAGRERSETPKAVARLQLFTFVPCQACALPLNGRHESHVLCSCSFLLGGVGARR
jgi:hypothetical protein